MNVFYEEGGSFKTATIKMENPGSLQVETASGKRTKIKTANVLLNFDDALDDFMALAQAEADTLDTDFLWECSEENEFGFEELAKAYYGDKPSNIQLAATAIKVHAAPVYFYRKGKGRYKAAPQETLKLALAAVEKKRLQAVQMAEWVEQLNNQQLPAGFIDKADHLIYQPDKNSLEWKAIEQAAASSGRLTLTVMADAGLIASAHDYHLGAFLREMFANGTDFPAFADVTAQLNAMVADLPMSEAEAFSIDDAATNEIDDAFSVVDLPNGNKRVGIHIAAPALAVLHGSDLDAVVLDRLSTVYMPGNKITMLPEAIVRPFSLDEGEIKPALSLYCEVAPDLTVVANKTKLERIKVKQNLRHDSLEPFFNSETLEKESGHPLWADLKFLHDFAESLEKARGKYDPNRAPQIDYNFYVNDGIVSIVARERGSPMDKLVAELMIYANSTWGALLKEGERVGIYRAQTGGKVFMTTEAMPHQGMGVAQYAWCTSPLRRAVDLVNQRQIMALINAEEAPYPKDGDALKVIIRDFDQTYQSYSDFQTRMERYWCLQYLIQEQLTEVTATVWRENLVRIDGLFFIAKVPSLPELKIGTKVALEIKHIDTLLMELNSKFKHVVAEVEADLEKEAVVDEVESE
ncbi:MAG: RNB domain-containing ribonuclease [Methylophilaceae bacterium]|nr:MAG: RNB domain-containing ribonuclease [Methylophilaceae bacterium]